MLLHQTYIQAKKTNLKTNKYLQQPYALSKICNSPKLQTLKNHTATLKQSNF